MSYTATPIPLPPLRRRHGNITATGLCLEAPSSNPTVNTLSLQGGVPSGWQRPLRRWFTTLCAVAVLAACGGGSDTASDADVTAASSSMSAAQVSTAAKLALASGPADPGLLLLLVPDSYAPDDARVGSWIHAALEVGVRIAPVTDTQFTALGEQARRYGGLVLPDDLHAVASDALLTQVKAYVNGGGKALLSFDFGALTLNGAGQPVFPFGSSRLSDLAGVEYVMYDELRDRTTGLGPVTGARATLRELSVPPGKSLPYSPAPFAQADAPQKAAAPRGGASSTRVGVARYLPVSPADPGGVRGFDPQQFQNVPQPSRSQRAKGRGGLPKVDYGAARLAPAVPAVTRSRPGSVPRANVPIMVPETSDPAVVVPELSSMVEKSFTMAAPDALDAISGYGYGYLTYPSYVTRGEFDGTTLATSPEHGLIAGTRAYGAGQVLFVNLPLTYLKGRTDALPMHGFLGYFVNNVVRAATISAMPDGIPGLTLNWHLDSMEAQAPTLALERAGVFSTNGPFAVDMTAGPDTITPGDGLGWNLNNNAVAKDILRRMDSLGHAVGSHGGWIHDYYGENATEDNRAGFEPFLAWNRDAVDSVIRRPGRQYSSPQGNNPTWAMDWLEERGVVGAYFGGHTGLGVTQHYRNGMLLNPNLKVLPVTPFGLYATFEEFQDFNVPKSDVIAWYRELVDFSMQLNTSRLIYMHPPGAQDWLDVTQNLMSYTRGKGKKNFRWYTMPMLADHLSQRLAVQWTQQVQANGRIRFDAAHPSSLASLVWRLPKTRYERPTISSGTATVSDGGSHWLVKPSAGTSLRFVARPI